MPYEQFKVLAENYAEKMGHAEMTACFSLMIADSQLQIPILTSAKVTNSAIGWYAVNSVKPGRDQIPAIVVQSTNDWAEANFDTPLAEVKAHILAELNRIIAIDYAAVEHIDIQRWRYAFVSKPSGVAFYWDKMSGLAACGDWCLGPKIESAFMSGYELAQALKADN